MQRLEITSETYSPNFIGAWLLEDTSICDNIIEFFEANPVKHNVGIVGGIVDETKKKTTDIVILPNSLEDPNYTVFKSYIGNLINCFNDYKEQFDFLKNITGIEIGRFNVQKYSAGGHFGALHAERDSSANQHRILAFMTYLNDVPAGGETSFHYYGLSVKPQKGKTLIWPAEWTHAHRGGLVEQGSKYIVTGWIQFA